jgi:PAS domain S-box-containing protein
LLERFRVPVERAAREAPTRGRDREGSGWSLKWHFALLAALFVATAGAAVAYTGADSAPIILVALAVVLLAVFGVYELVARPITRLAAAVRAERLAESHEAMPIGGPAQVRSLARAIDGLIVDVENQLAKRHRAEQATEVAEQSYRMLFETSPLAMWISDAETERLLEANASATELYGYSHAEFLAMRADALLAPARATNPDAPPAEAAPALRHLKKDGAEIEVGVARHAVQFRGRPATLVLAGDIGEREALGRQLRQSQRLESLGQLAGGVAHDFNNLLGVIIGYLGFVAEDLAVAAERDGGDRWTGARDHLEQIERAAQGAARLTRQLLLFARRDAGHKEIVDVNSVVEQTEEVLRHTLGEHVLLETRLDRDAWPVAIDPGQLEQVLVNLAVNARDAMPGGGALTIETTNVRVEQADAAARPGILAGPYLRVRINDTGAGMDEVTVDRAFEPFFTTKPTGEGTGLGLATVYGIVTQAGGRVQIYSEAGHGTSISVMLPASGEQPAPRGPGAVTIGGGDETILLAEDEASLRELTRQMLERHGYTVLCAEGGEGAVALARSEREAISLLVTDVVMPRMPGHEVAARIGELIPGVPVLYVSGYPEPLLGAQGKLDPSAELLEKPFTEQALLARVRELLDRPPRPAPAEV